MRISSDQIPFSPSQSERTLRDQFGWLYWTRKPASFAFATTSFTASIEKAFFFAFSSSEPSKQPCWTPQIVSRAGGPAGFGTLEKRLRWNVSWKR